MRQLTNEELGQLIKQAIEEGKDEARYFLIVKEYKGKNESVKIKQIYGEYELILMSTNAVSYTHLTLPTIYSV